jgi:hypothetical protein
VLQKNSPDFLNNQRVSLAGVAAAIDKFRLHVVDMHTGIIDDPVIAVRWLVIAVEGNDGSILRCP